MKSRINHFLEYFGTDTKTIYAISNEILKWSFISVLVGLIVGSIVSLTLNTLEKSLSLVDHLLILFLPFVLGFVSWVSFRYFKEASGDGTEEIIRALIHNDQRFNIIAFLFKQFSTFLTILFGGSVGKEAPATQIGAFISLMLSKLFRITTQERIIILIAGTSAGFAMVFGSPIAAGFFALEALFAGKILYRVLVPAFISSFVAFWIMQLLHTEYIYHPIAIGTIPSFWELINVVKIVVAGIYFGIVGYIVILFMKKANILAKSNFLHPFLKGFLGGSILLLFAFFTSEAFFGLGIETIENAFHPQTHYSWEYPFLKTLTTFITISSGGSGGFVTPIFFIGATSGNFLVQILDANIALFAALGFVSVLSGATNAPIASTILAAELFGIEVAHFAAVTATIAYLITSKQSVFEPEILEIIK